MTYHTPMRPKHYIILTVKQKLEVLAFQKKNGWKATDKKYGIPRTSIIHWRTKMKKGSVNGKHPLERKDKRHTIRQETEDLVKKIHKKYPHLSLAQIRERVLPTQKISRTKIWHVITGR